MWSSGAMGSGLSRAGSSSSGGFAYGDAPKQQTSTVTKDRTAPPCNVAPIQVDGTPYYKCGKAWYAPAYANAGMVYAQVPAPPGQ